MKSIFPANQTLCIWEAKVIDMVAGAKPREEKGAFDPRKFWTVIIELKANIDLNA